MPPRRRLPARRPHERLRANVRNQSSRHGAAIRGIVIHTTESHDRPGLSDLQAIVAWFDDPDSQASSHVVVDAEGLSAQCVPDERKAWTCSAYNPSTLNIELIGYAKLTAKAWDQRRPQIEKAAKYVAWWSRRHGIPIRRGEADHGTVTVRGVLTHSQLGRLGGGHRDPGRAFPIDELLRAARYYRRAGWPH